jgi:hypothetical protein
MPGCRSLVLLGSRCSSNRHCRLGNLIYKWHPLDIQGKLAPFSGGFGAWTIAARRANIYQRKEVNKGAGTVGERVCYFTLRQGEGMLAGLHAVGRIDWLEGDTFSLEGTYHLDPH